MSIVNGVVSLWVGTFENTLALENYLIFHYTEDGDYILPSIAEDFAMSYFDEDFREAEILASPSNVVENVLKGFSYENVIVPKFVELIGKTFGKRVNSVILLYNFHYDGRITKITKNGIELEFMGVVSYAQEPNKNAT